MTEKNLAKRVTSLFICYFFNENLNIVVHDLIKEVASKKEFEPLRNLHLWIE